ncbi:YgiQ family radical SAM protein [candidate division KSB1 bacterium]|nr:YgiQ family radical SAM protein [candidate division KSB1 bacterium]
MNANDSGRNKFIPISHEEMLQHGWEEVDIVLISGDAYVDHPSFGTAVIARVLQNRGFRIAIIAMPDYRNAGSIAVFGRPRLFFAVTSGNVDSMLTRYTAFKRLRSDDPYVPGGKAGCKPTRAVITYCNLIKQKYKEVPVIIGGIEASMRRLAHYDFWSNAVRRSILEDSRADLLVYGMGEAQIVDIAKRIKAGKPLTDIPGTVELTQQQPQQGSLLLPDEEGVLADKEKLLQLYRLFFKHYQNKRLSQPAGGRYLVHNPPAAVTQDKLDQVYDLPFMRKPHPSYKKAIPAFEMIRNSITAHRGCFSGCSFCSLGLHQGKKIVRRSPASIKREADNLSRDPDFKGHITDIGGPSANMYGAECKIDWRCNRESCTYPSLCSNLKINSHAWINLLAQVVRRPNIRHVTVGSGVRYDLFMNDDEEQNLDRLIAHHTSGQLKIAPEHTQAHVLRAMRKSPLVELKAFVRQFRDSAKRQDKQHYLLPYLMSCHPGSRLSDMIEMRNNLKWFGFIPEQVQAFIPLPMTLSSIIYYTGKDPLTGETFYVERDMNERRKQHDILLKSKRKRAKS